ncbi:MAG TPA: hypothetical protein VFW21_14415, partial [Mycobacterium sp.]|nr:hypothetical protein [Mycobacterium sp.]
MKRAPFRWKGARFVLGFRPYEAEELAACLAAGRLPCLPALADEELPALADDELPAVDDGAESLDGEVDPVDDAVEPLLV